MFLVTKGRYAIMAMINMSVQNGLAPVKLMKIAGSQQISLAYLEQIFVKLRKNQLVTASEAPMVGISSVNLALISALKRSCLL